MAWVGSQGHERKERAVMNGRDASKGVLRKKSIRGEKQGAKQLGSRCQSEWGSGRWLFWGEV